MKEIKMDEKKQNEILINCLLSAVHFDFSKEEKNENIKIDVVTRLRKVNENANHQDVIHDVHRADESSAAA